MDAMQLSSCSLVASCIDSKALCVINATVQPFIDPIAMFFYLQVLDNLPFDYIYEVRNIDGTPSKEHYTQLCSNMEPHHLGLHRVCTRALHCLPHPCRSATGRSSARWKSSSTCTATT